MEENFYLDNELEFEDENLQVLIIDLKYCYSDKQKYFVKLCEIIYNIWSYCKNNYWKAKNNEYYNSYKLLAKFGFDKKAVSRYKTCFERFIMLSNNNEFFLKPKYYYFSSSKLFELLSLSEETTINAIDNKLISPAMTVKEIREFVKTLKEGSDKAEKVLEDTSTINEDDIPMAFDPTKKYEFSYYEDKTRNQLLNMIWELQNTVQKLISKKK